MPNLLSPFVANIKAVDKSNKVVTAHNKADTKHQVFVTPSSGSTARLGNRILFNTEFGGNPNRFINDIYIKGKLKVLLPAPEQVVVRGGVLSAIEEIRLQVNEKNIFLYQNGLAEMALWDKYTNYNTIREFVMDNECFTNIERFRAEQSEAFHIATNAVPSIKLGSLINGGVTALSGGGNGEEFYIPMSTLTSMFNDASINHVKKMSIQILLKKGEGAGTVQESNIFGNVQNATSLNDLIEFTDLEMEILFDCYKPQHAVIDPKGPLVSHDVFFERKIYPLDSGTNNPVKINLNNDFTPLENIKRIYMWSQDTALPAADEASLFRRFGSLIGRWELRKNGVKILEAKTPLECHNHMRRYYRNLCRYRTDLYSETIPLITMSDFFIDLSRGSVKLNNNNSKTHKFINGLKNFTTEFGQYELLVYPNGGAWQVNTELCVTLCATRIFTLLDRSQGYGVSEEV